MTKTITLEPITRIEGHMKISIDLNKRGNVADAHTHLCGFRGFERFLVGRHITKVPIIASHVCGVCSVPHHIVSAKTIDIGLGVELPETAKMLREFMLMAGIAQDHLLHILVLGGPDFLLADLPPEQRGFTKLCEKFPSQVKEAIGVRAVFQSMIALLGTQAVHPLTAVPGGMSKPLTETHRNTLIKNVREAKKKIISWHDSIIEPVIEKCLNQYKDLGKLKTCFAGLVKGDSLEFYDGKMRIVAPGGKKVAEFEPPDYLRYIAEKPLGYTYANLCYVKPLEVPDGIYRVGPLARVNVAKSSTTEYAKKLLKDFKSKFGAVAQETLSYHIARYICLVYSVERAEELLMDDKILGKKSKVPVKIKSGEGVGMVEAPRGLLTHHYKWDSNGYVTMANLVVPTTVNSYSMDSSIKGVAARSIKNGKIDEPRLWHETGMMLRAYDPCVSCATHLDRGFKIEIIDHKGNLAKTVNDPQ